MCATLIEARDYKGTNVLLGGGIFMALKSPRADFARGRQN